MSAAVSYTAGPTNRTLLFEVACWRRNGAVEGQPWWGAPAVPEERPSGVRACVLVEPVDEVLVEPVDEVLVEAPVTKAKVAKTTKAATEEERRERVADRVHRRVVERTFAHVPALDWEPDVSFSAPSSAWPNGLTDPRIRQALDRVARAMSVVFRGDMATTRTPVEKALAYKAQATAHATAGRKASQKLAQERATASQKLAQERVTASQRLITTMGRHLERLAEGRFDRARRLRHAIVMGCAADELVALATELVEWVEGAGFAPKRGPDPFYSLFGRPVEHVVQPEARVRKMPLPSFHPRWRDEREYITRVRKEIIAEIRAVPGNGRVRGAAVEDFVDAVHDEVLQDFRGRVPGTKKKPSRKETISLCSERVRKRRFRGSDALAFAVPLDPPDDE